jgi:hypothetical protein
MKQTLVLCAAACLSAAVALGQAGGLGEISGTVRDSSGAVVPGAQVLVLNASRGVHITLTASDGGVFDVASLEPASGYEVTVNKTGFTEYDVKNVDVAVGRNVGLAVTLTVGATVTQVQVEGVAPLVDDTKTDVSQVVDSREIVDLPINGRRVDTFVLLTPAVTNDGIYGLLTFRGVANGNTFLVDGNDTTDQFWVENAGRTRTVSQLSQDAVQEFEVVSSNFSAEYGKASGGIVNAVTRSGTNDLHGTAFWFFRNQDLEALDAFTPAGVYPKDTRNQRGFSIGGPIKKNKLFFFLNGDFTNRDFPLQSSIIKAGIVDSTNEVWLGCGAPATAAQCSAINGLLPRFFGAFPRTVTSDLGFARIDYHLSDNNTLSASFNYMHWLSPNGIQTGSVVTTGGAISSNGNSVARVREGRVSWTSVPSSSLVNEARFGWLNDRQSDDINPALTGSGTGDLYLSVQAQQIGSTYYLPRVEPNEYRYEFADNASWTHGKHIVKFGTDIASTRDYSYFIQYANGYYTYQTVTNFALDYSSPGSATSGTPGKHWQSYEQAIGNPTVNTTIGDYDFYLQDQWRVNPKLTLNYGARYEYSHIPQPPKCNPDYPDTCHINSPTTNLMPRLGVAYSLNDKTVLRAGYGMFYARVAAATLQDLYTGNGVNTTTFNLAATSTTQFAAGPVFPNILSAVPSGASVSAASIQFTDPNWKTPYSEQATFALERQVTHDVSLTASYIWSRGVQLYGERDLNLPPLSSTTENYAIDNASGTQVGGFATPIYLVYSPTQSRPDGRYGAVVQDENGVTSSYNALAVQVRKRFVQGLQADLAYTWSHEIDDGQGYGQASQTIFMSSASSWLYNGNYKADKGNGLEDQRQRFVLSWVWAPTITHRIGAFYKYVVNNWQLSSITTINSQRPYGNATIKVNDTPVPGMFSNFTINGSGLSSRVPFLPANAIYQPAFYREDARLSKVIPFGDRYKLYLNFEAFNVSNSWSPTAMSSQEYTEKGGVLTLTPGAYAVGTSDGYFPDGTEARRLQVSARFTF